jgi:hypothetical protein
VEVCLLDLCFVRSHHRDCLLLFARGPCLSTLVSDHWPNGVEKHTVVEKPFDAVEIYPGVKANQRQPTSSLMNEIH